MDGAGKSIEDCMRRISRVVCGDMDVLKPDEIKEMAEYIYSEQVTKISEALLEVSKRIIYQMLLPQDLEWILIGAKACETAGLEYIGMDKILKKRTV
jgi:uncharacterized hydantoinase/oxoprolinase family protein